MADKLLEASWVEFFERCLVPDTPGYLVEELRLAFYAGASRTHRLLTKDPSRGAAIGAEIDEMRAELYDTGDDDDG